MSCCCTHKPCCCTCHGHRDHHEELKNYRIREEDYISQLNYYSNILRQISQDPLESWAKSLAKAALMTKVTRRV